MLDKMKIVHEIALLIFAVIALLCIMMYGKEFEQIHIAVIGIMSALLLFFGWYGHYLYFKTKEKLDEKEKELKKCHSELIRRQNKIWHDAIKK